MREAELREREQSLETQEQRIRESAATVLERRSTTCRGPASNRRSTASSAATSRQGETVVIGTMNNAGTVLLTIADMSIIEAEVEVDETDIPSVQLGQLAKVTIDAIPDKTFTGKVTEIGNSPIQTRPPPGRPARRRPTSR